MPSVVPTNTCSPTGVGVANLVTSPTCTRPPSLPDRGPDPEGAAGVGARREAAPARNPRRPGAAADPPAPVQGVAADVECTDAVGARQHDDRLRGGSAAVSRTATEGRQLAA